MNKNELIKDARFNWKEHPHINGNVKYKIAQSNKEIYIAPDGDGFGVMFVYQKNGQRIHEPIARDMPFNEAFLIAEDLAFINAKTFSNLDKENERYKTPASEAQRSMLHGMGYKEDTYGISKGEACDLIASLKR